MADSGVPKKGPSKPTPHAPRSYNARTGKTIDLKSGRVAGSYSSAGRFVPSRAEYSKSSRPTTKKTGPR